MFTPHRKGRLLLDFVSTLQPVDGRLWLGYGQLSSGGLGLLDLATRRFAPSTPH